MPTTNTAQPPVEELPPSRVMDSLSVVLVSPPFRNSRQCRDLLLYIVQHSIAADDGG